MTKNAAAREVKPIEVVSSDVSIPLNKETATFSKS
jgi:hypothetical protein